MKPNQQQRLLKSTDSSLFAANSALPRPVDGAPDNAGQAISKANSNVLLLKSGTSVHIPLLTPMFSSENVLNKLQGAPSNLMKVRDVVQLDGGVYGADSSKEHLRRRIKDLERDVSKLTNHVRQAEQSIQSYRTCLSDRSPRPSNSKDFATQTDTDAVSQLQLSLKSSNDRIDRLVSDLAAMKETKDLLFRERQQLSEAARGREHALQSSIAGHQETIQEQAEHLQLLRDRISGLEANSAVDSVSARSTDVAPLPVPDEQEEQAVCSPILLSTVKSLRDSLSSMASSFSLQLEVLRSKAAQDYHSIAVSAGIQLSSKRLQLEEQYTEMMQRLRSDNEELRMQLIAKTEMLNIQAERLQSLDGLSSKTPQLVSRHDSAASPSDRPSLSSAEGNSSQKSPTGHRPLPILEYQKGSQSPFVSNSSTRHDYQPSIESLRILQAVESCKSPKKSEFLSVVQETKYKLRLAEIEAEYSERLKQVEIKHRLQLSRQEQLSEDKMRQLEGGFRQQLTTLGGERDRLTAAHCHEQLRSMGYQQRIDDAAAALVGLREVHEAEIKAVKHEAHVKDLIRVGKEREASLERDRLLSKYILLSFITAFHISAYDRQSNSVI